MADTIDRKEMLAEYKKLLAMQIKLDIASTIRETPDLDASSTKRAYEQLSDNDNLDTMVADLAYEETIAAVDRGEVPPAALLLLAGFKPNPIVDC